MTKVVVFSTMNPTKLVLNFSEFSTIFYGIYKNQQIEFTIEVAILRWGPWEELGQATWPLAMAGGAGGQNSGDSGEGFSQEVVGEGARAHLGLTWAGVGGWEAGGERGRWRGSVAAAAANIPVRFCDNPPRKIPYYRLRPIHFGH
jgi:hypothetical protein